MGTGKVVRSLTIGICFDFTIFAGSRKVIFLLPFGFVVSLFRLY